MVFFLIGQGTGFHLGGGLRVAIQNINGGGLVIQIIVCAIPTINIKEASTIKVHLSVMRGVLHIVNSRIEIFFSPLQGFSQFLIVRLNRKVKPMTGFLCNALKRMKRPVITGKLNGNGFDFVRRDSVALNLKRIQKVCLLC